MREELQETLGKVAVQSITVDEAMDILDSKVLELAGKDEERANENGFPEKWGDKINTKRTWVNARNHLRRSIRAKWGKK